MLRWGGGGIRGLLRWWGSGWVREQGGRTRCIEGGAARDRSGGQDVLWGSLLLLVFLRALPVRSSTLLDRLLERFILDAEFASLFGLLRRFCSSFSRSACSLPTSPPRLSNFSP